MTAIRKAIALLVLGTLPSFVALPLVGHDRCLSADTTINEHDRSVAYSQWATHERLGEAPVGFGREVRAESLTRSGGEVRAESLNQFGGEVRAESLTGYGGERLAEAVLGFGSEIRG
jgi:hypothetical protein